MADGSAIDAGLVTITNTTNGKVTEKLSYI